MASRSKSARGRKRKSSAPLIQLSPAARLKTLGVVLLMVAMVTLLSLLSLSRSQITEAWLALLGQVFGWGRLAVPFGLGTIGVLVFLAGIERPVPLHVGRVLGVVLVFLTGEALLHALTFSPEPEALARMGGGGGYLGYGVQSLLWMTVGDVAGFLVLMVALIGAVLLVIDRPLADVGQGLVQAGQALLEVWDWATAWYRSHRRLPVGGGLPPAEGAATAVGRFFERRVEPAPARPVTIHSAVPPTGVSAAASSQAPLQPRVIGGAHEWVLPPLDAILEEGKEQELSEPEIRSKVRIIEDTLQHFGVPARVVEVNQGPTVTQFGVEPGFIERRDSEGKMRRFKIKVNRIQSLANDLALALAATTIRIEAPVPGRPMVGIEIPNAQAATVTLRSVMESENFRKLESRLRIALGIDVQGQAVVADLATMPHLLIAGATGAGKSVCINAIIACLLCNNTPDQLRLIMVDPKRVELTGYNGIPHLLTPVVVDIEKVVGTLKWVTREMERRYRIFSQVGVRNIEGYNASAPARNDPPLPYLVVLIDELADMMMVAPDEVERHICRIAQLARATGIHLVIATQRPSVDVVTGLIKANFPARIAFAVSTQIDSRVILDGPGAEQLLGRGDMLFMAPDASKMVRAQGCWVSDPELEKLTNYWKNLSLAQSPVDPLPPEGTPLVQRPLMPDLIGDEEEEDEADALLDEAITLVRAQQRASVTLLQRKLRVGYARAARLMDLLEERGIVGPAEGANHSREVLAPAEDEDGDDAPQEYGAGA